jgi:hypothetical protein
MNSHPAGNDFAQRSAYTNSLNDYQSKENGIIKIFNLCLQVLIQKEELFSTI